MISDQGELDLKYVHCNVPNCYLDNLEISSGA